MSIYYTDLSHYCDYRTYLYIKYTAVFVLIFNSLSLYALDHCT